MFAFSGHKRCSQCLPSLLLPPSLFRYISSLYQKSALKIITLWREAFPLQLSQKAELLSWISNSNDIKSEIDLYLQSGFLAQSQKLTVSDNHLTSSSPSPNH